MLLCSTVSSFLLALLVAADPAPISDDSPQGALYLAKFEKGEIKGAVTFFALAGYVFGLTRLEGLPEGGPFLYGVHQKPVPKSGNCKKILGAFDPYHGVPDAPTEAEYKVGDISGKHGPITERAYVDVYRDPYMSLNPLNRAYIGDLSVGIRRKDGTRIDCANIKKVSGEIPKDALTKAKKMLAEDGKVRL